MISLKLLLVLVIFLFSIVAAISITLTIYFAGSSTIQREVLQLASTRAHMSVSALEAKFSFSYDALASAANASVRSISVLDFASPTSSLSVDRAITACVKLAVREGYTWSFVAIQTRYKNGDVFFFRNANKGQPQITVGRSPDAFWNNTAA